jgi:hypothetical protein
MKYLFLDFETYYDKEYSLKKMAPVEYILDPRWETIGCAFQEGFHNDANRYWAEGPDVQRALMQYDPEDTVTVCYNALFDNCILAWRYGFVPKLMVDMMGVSRATLGHLLRSLSLESVALHLGVGVKGGAVKRAAGMHLADLKQQGDFYLEYVAYAMNDVGMLLGAYDKLVRSGKFPASELVVNDMVLRCAVEPRFQLDADVLALHLAEVRAKKKALLDQAMLTAGSKSDLMSNEKFAAMLRNLGVEPPTKVSPVTQKVTYAFAKTDPAFIELEEHDDPMVQALVGARLGLKSTLEETRTERLLAIANLQWPDFWRTKRELTGMPSRALMPIPLRYGAAHTHRLGGDWKLNLQNLPRGGNLRRSLKAPPGYVVVAADAAQIEARIVAWICGQLDLVAQFAAGEDIYSLFASEVFGHPVNRKLPDPDHIGKGFVGKTGILGLGYSLGWVKFQRSVKTLSRAQLGRVIELSDDEAQKTVNTYRRKYHHIKNAWRELNDFGIPVLANGGEYTFGPCVFEKGAILLPSGLRLHYHNLRQVDGDKGPQWLFDYAGKPKRLYGGALLENIVQALARIIVMDAAVRAQKRLARAGIFLNLQVHDELVMLVPEKFAEVTRRILEEEMAKRPSWAPTLPLKAESGRGENYASAK